MPSPSAWQMRALMEALASALSKRQVTSTGTGPVKWCKRCSRKHRSQERCDLVAVMVRANSGRTVQRLVHRSRTEAR